MTEMNCPECGASYQLGAMFCTGCGAKLDSDDLDTMVGGITIPPETQIITKPSRSMRVPTGTVVFIILSSGRRVEILLDGAIQIGRLDPNRDIHPQLDLTVDDGASLGVSRIHASLQSTENGVMLVDLGSTNGTYLRDESLKPHVPEFVHSGDMFQMGHLQVQVFFNM